MTTEQDLVKQITKELIEKGKIIEAGWMALKILIIPEGASDAQISDMRIAFFAGAQHLFESIMSSLDPGDEETLGDIRRMDMISKELSDFAIQLRKMTEKKNEN